MLNLVNVSKVFNPGTINEKKPLKSINLTLNDGDFVTVIGGNGAGKSTLLNAISGVFPIDEGSIFIDNNDITSMPEHKRAKFIGRVFQDPMLGTAADMWVEENMSIAEKRGDRRKIKWAISHSDRLRYKEMLSQLGLGLENYLTKKMGLLSGGQRQAITLLMAAMKKPQLLLLDEHTAALDPATAAKVLELTDKIVTENHLTAIMITHNMNDAIKHGNRLIMMNQGNIIYDVSGEEKSKLTKADLLNKFAEISGGQESDRMVLS